MLLISYSYPPVVGGSEVEAQRVCAALRQRGHRIRIFCAGGEPMPPVKDWVDSRGLPVRLFGGRWPARWRGYAFAAGVAWGLWRERREHELVYFLMTGLHLATGVPLARLLGKGVIMKFSGSSLVREMTRSWLGRLELRFLRKWADRVLVLNPGMMQEARETGFAGEQLLWMPNPVDTEEFQPCGEEERAARRQELGLPPAARVVLFVGRLAPEKALPPLLGAFARVRREHPDALLVLVGDGPSRGELSERARALGLEGHVRFAGMVAAAAVPKWLQAADVFALVSLLEGFPCSLIEAMAAGLPSLVSDIPATVQLIEHEAQGLVAEAQNEEALAGGLGRLLGDPALRARLGAAARQRILENYSSERIASLYERLLGEVLNRAARRR